MEKIIIEVGSTSTKVDLFDGKVVTRICSKTISFKKHFKEDDSSRKSDVDLLILLVKELKCKYNDFFVCGTSIFRKLDDSEKKKFINEFKSFTSLDFNIISQDEENELTVLGATRFTRGRVAVFIGGGGSTEIAIYDNGIVSTSNSDIGVIDLLDKYSDLLLDYAKSDLNEIKAYIREKLNFPSEKADVLILAGGGHERFAREANLSYEDNSLYEDSASPIMMSMDVRIKDTEKYFYDVSLNNIKDKYGDADWWNATRAMCAFVLVVCEESLAKYIVPTDITMVYGIIAKYF